MTEPWFDELTELLRIPSFSADEAKAGEVMRAAGWVRDFIVAAGGTCEIVDWHGQPLINGEIRASVDPDGAPTVIAYAHFDVQPPDPLELWDSAPFEPEIRDGYLYARGAVDDKGHLYMLLCAARELASAGELPVNVRFCCDGEEETGGHSIVEFLEADERGADAAVIFDSGMIARDVPAFNVATRGMSYFHVTLRTGTRDLHSGLYGGAALNAAHALIEALGALVAKDGLLVESLRKGIVAPTEGRSCAAGGWAAVRAPVSWPTRAHGPRTIARPTTSLLAHLRRAGAGRERDRRRVHHSLQKAVLPVEAVANVSIRLAPGQRVEEIAPGGRAPTCGPPLRQERDLEDRAVGNIAARPRATGCDRPIPARPRRLREGLRPAARR